MILNLSWRDFLNRHPQKNDLNKHANMIQERLTLEPDAQSKFKILDTYKNLVALSKNPHNNDIQATFFHTTIHGPIHLTNPTSHLALTGFHSRATAVKINPEELMHRSNPIPVPSLPTLLNCATTADIRALDVTTFTETLALPSAVVIPPSLATEIYREENMSATHIIIKFIQRIIKLREPDFDDTRTDEDTITSSLGECNQEQENLEENSNDGTDNGSNNGTPGAPNQTQLDFEKDSYHPALLFLWGVLLNKNEIQSCILTNCFKQATVEWTEEQHRLHLNLGHQMGDIPPPTHQLAPSTQSSTIDPITRLANAIAGRDLNEALDREDSGNT